MTPELTGKQWWVCVDGPCGTEYIPADVCGRISGDKDECFAQVRDYCENRECWSISEVEGYGARLSAPGYLDCTEWMVFESEAEARRELCDMYELCPVCGESIYDDCSDNPACRFHHAKR